MAFVFQPLTEAQARKIIGWRYEPPYDVYNLDREDPEAVVEDLLHPDHAYHALLTPEGELVAFCCFGRDGQVPGGNYDSDALDLGLGVRPDLTGQGQGSTYVQAVLDFAQRSFSARAFRVTIAAYNARAQRVWQKAGFRPVERFESAHSRQPFVIYRYGM
jgi:RimJ/RimL family protein N-acetyltransferase